MRLLSRLVFVVLCCGQRTAQTCASPRTPPLSFRFLRGAGQNTTQYVRRWGGWAQKSEVPTRRMPTLFDEKDAMYDRYAACLAATEGLRRFRNEQLAKASAQCNTADKPSSRFKLAHAETRIMASYVNDASKVVKSMGMPLDEFNAVGRELQGNSLLKQKVVEQAYLYRMQASVQSERVSLSRHVSPQSTRQSATPSKLDAFCRSMVEIEMLRQAHSARLLSDCNLDRLPTGINDPTLLPLMHPDARMIVEDFPNRAHQIIQQHDLDADEFNRLLQKTERNAFFRWKIHRRLKAQASASEKA